MTSRVKRSRLSKSQGDKKPAAVKFPDKSPFVLLFPPFESNWSSLLVCDEHVRVSAWQKAEHAAQIAHAVPLLRREPLKNGPMRTARQPSRLNTLSFTRLIQPVFCVPMSLLSVVMSPEAWYITTKFATRIFRKTCTRWEIFTLIEILVCGLEVYA